MTHHEMAKVQVTPDPPYHVVATDMDGTLLNENHEVSDFTKATIQKLITTYQLPPKSPRSEAANERHHRGNGNTDNTNQNDSVNNNYAGSGEGRFRVFFVIASGRHVHDLVYILQGLDLPDYSGYIVSSNGAKAHCIVHNAPAGEAVPSTDSVGRNGKNWQLKEVRAAYLVPSQVYKLLKLLPEDEDEINVNLYTSDGWFCSLDWRDELQYYRSGFAYKLFSPKEKIAQYEAFLKAQESSDGNGSGVMPKSVDNNPANPLSGVEKLYVGTDNLDRLQQLCRIVANKESPTVLPHYVDAGEAAEPFDVMASFSSKYCMEMTARGVTKAAGIDHLMPFLTTRSDSVSKWTAADTCIAFGDGENDEQMLLAAAKGCMMGNSGAKLRSLLAGADNVEEVGTNTEDGVAKKIIEVFHLDTAGSHQQQPLAHR